MKRRNIWLIVGGLFTLVAFLCVLLGVAGLLALREFQSRQQTAELQPPTPVAGLVEELPTTGQPPTIAPSPASELRQPTVAPTPLQPDGTTAAQATPGESMTLDPLVAPDLESLPDLTTALSAEAQNALAQNPNAPLYRIDAQLDPAQGLIAGAQTVRVTNSEDAPLNDIYFRIYANAAHFNEGGITVEDVRVDGQPATTQLELDETALNITLPQPLEPGQSQVISMRFLTTVPSSGGGYGIFNEADGVFALYHWHPELAVYEDGAWVLHPAADQGDLTNTDSANYVTTFAAPADYTVVTSGVETEESTTEDYVTHQAISVLARNFVVVASDQLEVMSQPVGEYTVNSYYLAGSETGGAAALASAAKSVELFSDRFGPYVYPELDVAQIRMGGGAAGMEASGLIMIGSDFYDPTQNPLGDLGGLIEGVSPTTFLDFIVAHEVAHQWWYGVVGSDAYQQPWLDEGLTNWSSAFYFDELEGEEAGLFARDMFIGVPYQMVRAQGDERLDQPVDQFSELSYSAIVYGKGALMYDALRQEIGDEQFFTFLQRYYQDYQFGRVDGDDWLTALAAEIGQDTADAFYAKWVEGTTLDDTDIPEGGPISELFGGNLDGLDELVPTPQE